MQKDTSYRPLAVSVREAAKLMAICETKVWYAIRDGKITPTRIGGRTLILMSEIERFLDAHTPRQAA